MLNDNLASIMLTEFQKRFSSFKKNVLEGIENDGWKQAPLSCLTDFQYGKMVPESERLEKGYPIFSGYGITGYYNEYMFAEPTIVVLARGVSGTGDVRISPKYSYITNLSIALRLKNPLYFSYLYVYLKNDNLRALDSGSAQSMITVDSLSRHKIAIPPKDVAASYDRFAKELLDVIHKNEEEMDKLSILSKSMLSILSR